MLSLFLPSANFMIYCESTGKLKLRRTLYAMYNLHVRAGVMRSIW